MVKWWLTFCCFFHATVGKYWRIVDLLLPLSLVKSHLAIVQSLGIRACGRSIKRMLFWPVHYSWLQLTIFILLKYWLYLAVVFIVRHLFFLYLVTVTFWIYIVVANKLIVEFTIARVCNIVALKWRMILCKRMQILMSVVPWLLLISVYLFDCI